MMFSASLNGRAQAGLEIRVLVVFRESIGFQESLTNTANAYSEFTLMKVSKLGANVILVVFIAVCKVGASMKKVPLYKGAPTNHVADFEQDESDSDSNKQQKLVDAIVGFMAGSDHPPLRGCTLPHCKAAPDLICGRVPPLLLSLLS
ncbi:hypothetical protein Syun_004126 [Stephania yunnanensis]|uniref:Uncharacterized protein n=1 Tax=Stephania yunnanensis TaxID=152371 RepID=A0AAP0Q290_9MAGN